jgi:hypothetical protein
MNGPREGPKVKRAPSRNQQRPARAKRTPSRNLQRPARAGAIKDPRAAPKGQRTMNEHSGIRNDDASPRTIDIGYE